MTRSYVLKSNLFDIRFKFRNCLIIISFPFLMLITTILLLDGNSMMCWGLLAAFIHECGHIWAMVLRKSKPKQICFQAFFIDIIDSSNTQRDYNADIFILLAGPLSNLIIAIVLLISHRFFNCQSLKIFAIANLFLAVFNLLPIETLDGGQIALNLLLRKCNIKTAERVSFLLSLSILFPLAILGFYVLIRSKYNFSLLFLSCYLIAILLFKNKSCYC